MKTPRFVGLLALALSSACTVEPSSVVTVSELLADTGRYEGRDVTVLVSELEARIVQNAAACDYSPCNNAVAGFGAGALSLRAAPDYRAPIPAFGELPQYWAPYDGYGVPAQLGCHGNEVELRCAPAVPAAIQEVHGRFFEDGTLIVDSVVIDPEVTEQTVERGIVLRNAEWHDEVPRGCVEACESVVRPE